MFSNLAIPQDQPRSVTVTAIEMVNTPFLDQAHGRQQLIKDLGDDLDSGQAMALVVFDGSEVRVLHGLTTDAASLVKILKELGGQLPALQGVRPSTQAETVGPLLVPTGAETATQSIRSFIDGGVTYAGGAQQYAVLATMRAFVIIARIAIWDSRTKSADLGHRQFSVLHEFPGYLTREHSRRSTDV